METCNVGKMKLVQCTTSEEYNVSACLFPVQSKKFMKVGKSGALHVHSADLLNKKLHLIAYQLQLVQHITPDDRQ